MSALTAAGTISIQLQQVSDELPLLVEQDHTLDALMQNSRAEQVSTMSYRIPMETALPGSVAYGNLDSASVAFPISGSSEYQQGTLTPVSRIVPIGWTKLAQLVDKGPVAVANAVENELGKAMDRLKQSRDMELCCGDGAGFLANVTAVNSGTLTITLNNNDFGARSLVKNQYVQVFNGLTLRPSTNSYGTDIQVLSISKPLGGGQTITVDQIPTGMVAGDVIRMSGVASGAPQGINGIPYYLSNSTAGTTLGCSRSVSDWVVANGYSVNTATVTLPVLKLPIDQIIQSLGRSAVKPGSLVIHTSPGQRAAYEALGYTLQMLPLSDGKAGSLDPFFSGKKSIEGFAIEENIHAHNQRWDYLHTKGWGKIKWGAPPFWYDVDGKKVFEQISAAGTPTAGQNSYLIDTAQYYVDNAKAQSSLYSCAQMTGY